MAPAASGAEKPSGRNARVALVFLSKKGSSWPWPGFDVKKREKEIIELLGKDCPQVEFVPTVIANANDVQKAIALGGVMGSKDTEVTNATTNILFESAYFNPVSVRRTSRGLGLISESSYRFERSVDMGMVPLASDKACSMIMDLCGGKAGPIEDKGKATPKEKKIPQADLERARARKNSFEGEPAAHTYEEEE